MSDPFLAEVRIVSFNFAPKGWALANGQLMPINQNQALFALLGTTFGGDGRTTFALPNLQTRAPIHFGNGHTLGEAGGEVNHTLSQNETPAHTHVVTASSSPADSPQPSPNVLAQAAGKIYGNPANAGVLNNATITSVGGSQPHQNMQPYLTLAFCIALIGIFPSQN